MEGICLAYELSDYGNGIINERSFYVLLRGKYGLGKDLYEMGSIKRSKEILKDFNSEEYIKSPDEVCGMLGTKGLEKLDQHFIDYCGLTDAFLAQLKFYPWGGGWRIGHFARRIPLLYVQSLKEGKNKFPYESQNYFLLNDIWEKIGKKITPLK